MKIEKRIIKMRRAEPARERVLGRYHASEIYDIYSGKKRPEDFFKRDPLSDETLHIFEIGKMYHEHVQSFYPPEAREYRIEMTFDDGTGDKFVISGYIDLYPKHEELGICIPGELKTCSTLPKSINRSHESQCRMYVHATNSPFGFVTYIEKNPKKIVTKDFKIMHNEAQFLKEVEAVRKFHNQLKKIYLHK